MHFKGDILITDPCYLMKENGDDWDRCGYGDNLDILGFSQFLNADTGYGDWSCSTFRGPVRDQVSEKDFLGGFGADAGLVCVVYLKDVLKYNPSWDYHLSLKPCVTWIKDFDGDVEIKRDDDGSAVVVGTGNIDFFTMQV